jgi:Asp-tRNA(Asn)/Glu-tRNA(Gln) amidotransferase A subunit family amidase
MHTVDHSTGAVMAFDDDQAVANARALDDQFAGGEAPGVLHGLPITVKDWIDVAGFPCTGGSDAYQDRRPREDATVVRRLRRAGAVVLAKTKVWDSGGAAVRHPLRPGRSVGGSSSGEAALGGGGSVLGIGSDSGGSVRLPAAWTGAIGFKPTAGLVPTTGHFPRDVGSINDGNNASSMAPRSASQAGDPSRA